jgi:hypothetical protein
MPRFIDLPANMLLLTFSPPILHCPKSSKNTIHVSCVDFKIHQKERPCSFGDCDQINHEPHGSGNQDSEKRFHNDCMKDAEKFEKPT